MLGAGESDEELAKRLQDLFDREAGAPIQRPSLTPPAASFGPNVRPDHPGGAQSGIGGGGGWRSIMPGGRPSTPALPLPAPLLSV